MLTDLAQVPGPSRNTEAFEMSYLIVAFAAHTRIGLAFVDV